MLYIHVLQSSVWCEVAEFCSKDVFPFSARTLLAGREEGHLAGENLLQKSPKAFGKPGLH